MSLLYTRTKLVVRELNRVNFELRDTHEHKRNRYQSLTDIVQIHDGIDRRKDRSYYAFKK